MGRYLRVTGKDNDPVRDDTLIVDFQVLQSLLDELSDGEGLKVEVVEMTEEEYEALPEFMGF